MSCQKTPSMASAAILLVSLLSFTGSQDIQPVINNPSGLQIAWNPSTSQLGIWRQLPQTTTPQPTGSSPPPSTTPPSSGSTTPPPTGSSSTGSASSPAPTSSSPLPPPTTTSPAPAPTTGRINITIQSLQEMDTNNTALVSFSSFQSLGLGSPQTVSPPVMIPNLPGSSGQTAVQAICQSASGQIQLTNTTTSATAPVFNVTLCVVTSSGSVNYNNEMIPVMAGQLVASVRVQNWQWTSAGVNLALNLTITVPTGRQLNVIVQNTTFVNVSLGVSNSYALLSSKVTSDYQNYVQMASGYPAFSQSADSKQSASVVVMMPKLAGQQATWNGLIDPGYTPAGPPPGPVSSAVRLHGVVFQVLYVLACCFSVLIFRH